MANESSKPHQDPIHQGLRRPPVDGLAAAQLDIEQLHKRVAQVAEACGRDDGILRTSIELLQNSVNALQITVGSLVGRVDDQKKQISSLEDAQDKVHQRMMQLVDQIQALEAK